ncbi:hypothetical protein DDE82_003839 [Stemphylium lycopersici]|nr:hypothetical protein TW65_07360 [Stemphylium lycopersici]RAR05650.1 hypothetical protein DDE82_003839 [Stemphylium lycopersici]
MAPLKTYEGTFSFVSSRLYDNIKYAMPGYDKNDPKNWPYVTLATIEKHRPYQGYPDLPAGVAYQRSITKRYEDMYSAEERIQSASMNGSFHKRYPFNYDEHDEPKEKVGMFVAEYRRYMANGCELPLPQLRSGKSSTAENQAWDRKLCANKTCIQIKREAARLRGHLFDKESQLMSSQQDLKEYETTEVLRRNAINDAEFEQEREKQCADAAEKECMLLMESNIKLMSRIRDLEVKASQIDDLGAYCTQLEAEIGALENKGTVEKRGRDEVESDPYEDLMEGYKDSKRMKSSSMDWQ